MTKQNMNVLFIHEVDFLKKVVFELHSLSGILSLLGHHVYAIDYEDKWKFSGSLYARTRILTNVSRAFPSASVSLIRPGFVKFPGISRMSAFITHYIEIEKTIRQRHIDIIVLYSVPTNGIQTIRLAKKYRIPVVFRSIDILNQLVPSPPLRPWTSLLEKYVYRRVDLILTLSPKLSEYVINKGAEEDNVRILPLGVDTSVFNPFVDPAPVRRRWGIMEDELIILYIGTFFEFSGLDNMIQRFPEVLKSVPKAKFLIVGDGPLRSNLDKIIRDLNLSNQVIITGFQPYETMPQFINLSRICVNPFAITDATREIIPGKIFQYLACAKPVLSTALPGMISSLPQYDSGLIYAQDTDDMTEKIIALLKSPEQQRELGQRGLEYAKQKHDYNKIGHDFETILEDLIVRTQKEKRYSGSSLTPN